MSGPYGPKHPDGGGDDDATGGEASAGGGRAQSLTGQVRKALLGGASALLGSEDGLRGALSEVKLPKDAMRLLVHQAERTRDEVTSLIGREVKRALRGADLRGELRRALLGMRIDVRASVRFRADDEAPAVKMRSQVRRRRRPGGTRDSAGRVGAQGGPEAAGEGAAAVPVGSQKTAVGADVPPVEPRPEG